MKPRAFTIIEVVLAITLLIILVTSVYPLVGWMRTKSIRLQYDSQAALVLQEGMEAAYSVMMSDWSGFPPGPGYFYPIIDASSGTPVWKLTAGIQSNYQARFERKILISQVCRRLVTGQMENTPCQADYPADPYSRKVTTTVSWRESGKTKSINAQLLTVSINR